MTSHMHFAYEFSIKLATGDPKNDDFSDKSDLYRFMHESFNNITCLIPKCAERHGLRGGVIICFMTLGFMKYYDKCSSQ